MDELTYEITSLRGENIKHFQLPDGTYQAVVYGEPVHILNADGEWEEIDNSLIEANGVIATSDSRIQFAKKITGNGSLYTLKNENYKVTLGLSGAQKKVEGVVANDSDSNEETTKLQKLVNIKNITSNITYSDILDGVDIEYIVDSNSIKENIIVKKPSENYCYTFTLALNGLTAELENGNILLCNSSSSEVIYYIPAPYMYDATGNESVDVYYTLTKSNNGNYEFTLTADAEWINSDNRSFPVVIDPSLVDIGQIDDTYVSLFNRTKNYGRTHELLVSSINETYYKFVTPNLPNGTYITSATVKFPYYFDSTNDSYMSVNLYQISSSWYEDYVTWNTKPSMNYTCLDTIDLYANGATSTNPLYASFSVTDYIRSWYTGTANHGFALKRTGGTASYVKFLAKEKMQKFAQLTINYTGTHLAEGVYAIGKRGTDYYFKSYIPNNLAWVLQDTTSYTDPPLTSSNLENLFKITYRPNYNDYVIRSMLDSSLVVYPSVYNNAPIAGCRSESDSQFSTEYTWKIEYTGGYYYITYIENGTKYYVQSPSSANNNRLIFTTNASDNGTKWHFHKYTDNVYEDIEPVDFDYQLTVGEMHQYSAYMRSTRIGHNGPVYYCVTDANGATTDRAEINPQSGLLTARGNGIIQLRVSYPGAPWIWCWHISIGGTFVVGEVPTSLRSNASHLCIPCAVTNIASFWCVSKQLSQFECSTAEELESRAQEVSEAMSNAGSNTANANIQHGYDIFSHTENGITYNLDSNNCWASNNQFDWNSIVTEINAGRPVMLGFASGNGSPYNSHITVCVGYSVEDEDRFVYLSDSHNDGYMRCQFSESYNDFISKVTLITN